ncbi:cytochrome b/b6 domain-containing protein [Shewanella surugensis]|uniref:Cytochrome b/b6 domain-containing protein n=1 Tax=Shewanella surugensis TaxID=212020 RepID=A0ABT0LBY4_9GAMM|nr:cytochrome b/b6 domain-containing protein [Shewanella surugensis]MCL1125025.1 cytochrome b/b6 domain-containing protein [Shewanella surugensis]
MSSRSEIQQTYTVWDLPSRIFHWVNLLLVVLLLFVGLIMLFKPELGITGLAAKIKLKELHIVIGYGFAINLAMRLLWGFIGNKFARWGTLFFNKEDLKQYINAMKNNNTPQYIGHNPFGKIAIILILLTLLIISITGLIRAGTDVYYPPFGGITQEYIAQKNVDPASIKPYDKTGVDDKKYAVLSPYKGLAGKVHLYSVYFLILLILLHVVGVVLAEIKHQPGIVSAMISGKKSLKSSDKNE